MRKLLIPLVPVAVVSLLYILLADMSENGLPTASEVKSVELYCYTAPSDAEKRVVTEPSDIKELYTLFDELALQDRKSGMPADKPTTSFRFNLLDGTGYGLIYRSVAVKSGRIQIPSENEDYLTSADVGGRWDNYSNYKAVQVAESELPGIGRF